MFGTYVTKLALCAINVLINDIVFVTDEAGKKTLLISNLDRGTEHGSLGLRQ